MNTQGNYLEFHQFLGKYADYLESLVEGEMEKLAAILSNDVKRIDQSVAAQQAVAMQMGIYEKKRAKLQQEAGLPDKPLRELIPTVPEEYRHELESFLEKMNAAGEEIRFYNDKSLEVVKLNLQRFGETGQLAPEAMGYTAAKENQNPYKTGGLYEKKI